MKTTLDLPDDLVRAMKILAVQENRSLKDTLAELLRRGLAQEGGVTAPIRAQLPLVVCAHAAHPDKEMTPERVAAVLLEEEAAAHRDPLR
jgi:plasmid stability protein